MEVVSFTFKLRVTVISLFLIIATEDCAKGAFPLEPKDIIFVGLSQPNAYHKGRAEVFRQHLEEQFKDLKHPEQPVIHLLHERWPTTGSWTILPILPSIATVHKMQKWLFVSDVETRLNVTKLLHSLSSYNHDESLFIGRGLHNEEACITYHLRLDIPIAFPDFAAGFLISSELIKIVSERLNAVKPKPEFSIDVKYELALYIHNKGEGVLLTEVSFLCAAEHQEECATTYPLKFPDCVSTRFLLLVCL
ncbi:hypothetical protein LSAT2_000031 [Lamellibrachia satsuma]|nr:hypothetical protein LSAT2_000031 [Lamellibrachia satsuma]